MGAHRRAAEADVAALRKLLDGGKPDRRAGGTIKGLAVMVAAHGQEIRDAELVVRAVAVAEAAAKKDWATADTLARALTLAPGGDVFPKRELHTEAQLSLEDMMSPFRTAKVGGLNVEQDLKAAMRAGQMAPRDAELLGTRVVVIADLTAQFPPKDPKERGQRLQLQGWEKNVQTMRDVARQLAVEGTKGNGQVGLLLKRLDASCVNCHNDFRD
jgi:hypothetical protein